jgi:hypothetical protein
MGNYRRLLAPAIILPHYDPDKMNKPWMAQSLGPKSVVELVQPAALSPILPTITLVNGCREVYVRWVDIVGRDNKGWLARDTPMDSKGSALLSTGRDDLKVGAWDRLREEIFASGLNARQYIATKVTEQPQLTQLQAVIR